MRMILILGLLILDAVGATYLIAKSNVEDSVEQQDSLMWKGTEAQIDKEAFRDCVKKAPVREGVKIVDVECIMDESLHLHKMRHQ